MSKYVYHYCASCQKGYSVTKVDGIVVMENKIISMSDYSRLKSIIRDNDDLGETTIDSLSFLHEVQS